MSVSKMKSVIEPTHKQIECSRYMGWEYIGDGLFAKGDVLGYFTEDGFCRD